MSAWSVLQYFQGFKSFLAFTSSRRLRPFSLPLFVYPSVSVLKEPESEIVSAFSIFECSLQPKWPRSNDVTVARLLSALECVRRALPDIILHCFQKAPNFPTTLHQKVWQHWKKAYDVSALASGWSGEHASSSCFSPQGGALRNSRYFNNFSWMTQAPSLNISSRFLNKLSSLTLFDHCDIVPLSFKVTARMGNRRVQIENPLIQ